MFDVRKEMEFWTGIMRDHGDFLYNSLSPSEEEAVKKSKAFMNLFDQLHKEVKEITENISNTNLDNMISRNIDALNSFIKFKEEILTRILRCSIKINLPPTFINHMLNEAMEYYRVLCLAQHRAPFNAVLENIRLHKIWLRDASGHAASIAADLDPNETELMEEAKSFQRLFSNMFNKAYEMYTMYERTGLQDGILGHFNLQISKVMEGFIKYLEEIKSLRVGCEILGFLPPIIPDHMIREENYYLYRVKVLYEIKC